MKLNQIPTILAVVLAIICVFAFRQPILTYHYGVASQAATGWVVAEEVNGEIQNVDYECPTVRVPPCEVSSNTVYTAGQTIPFMNAQIEVASRTFVDLDPNK